MSAGNAGIHGHRFNGNGGIAHCRPAADALSRENLECLFDYAGLEENRFSTEEGLSAARAARGNTGEAHDVDRRGWLLIGESLGRRWRPIRRDYPPRRSLRSPFNAREAVTTDDFCVRWLLRDRYARSSASRVEHPTPGDARHAAWSDRANTDLRSGGDPKRLPIKRAEHTTTLCYGPRADRHSFGLRTARVTCLFHSSSRHRKTFTRGTPRFAP